MLLFLVTLKNFDVCIVTMGVASLKEYTPLITLKYNSIQYMRQNIKINIGVGGLHGNQNY